MKLGGARLAAGRKWIYNGCVERPPDHQLNSLIPGACNPLAWDRYAYTLNAPTRYTDPSGHMVADDKSGGLPYLCPAYIKGNNSQQILSQGQRTRIEQYDPKTYYKNWPKQLWHYAEFIKSHKLLNDSLTFVSNYGRPVYKHIKGFYSFSPLTEGFMGAGTQFAQDLVDPTVSPNEYAGRVVVIFVEDIITDVVSTFVGARITGPLLAGIGAAATAETGPGAVVGGGFSGLVGYLGGAYGTTLLMDEYFWKPLNYQLYPELFYGWR